MLLVAVSVPHVTEDFQYGQFSRPAIAETALAMVYLSQLGGVTMVIRSLPAGLTVLGLAALVWFVGAAAIHGPQITAAGPYRHGLISKGLEIVLMLTSAATAVVGLWQKKR